MSQLVVNLPSINVWVRKEYLTDFQHGKGEFVRGVWISAKSIPGRAFYFETYLPEYGAMYDKLPISAFVASPVTPTPDLKLPDLQFWNCMDYGITVIRKSFISSMDFELYTRSGTKMKGSYLFTLDNYHGDVNMIDTNTSEKPDEHKSHNVIQLANGQFAIYPNNRMRIYDLSLTPEKPLRPDFKVSTQIYQVENGLDWKRLGDTDEYFWKNSDEDFEK
jgi:hypothetical protein